MTYKIARDGQEFGPYSLADVQRYVGTGNILLSDFALAEGATEWIPVSQVVGTIAVPPAVPVGYAAMPQFPDPPNLNWGLVLLLDLVTCGFFNIAWNLVQALWMKKVQPETKALQWYIVILVIAALNIIVSAGRVVSISGGRVTHGFTPLIDLAALFGIASLVLNWVIYPFVMRSSLLKHFNEVDPIGLELNGVMTFFFTSLYFQYHLSRINEIKRALRLGNPF